MTHAAAAVTATVASLVALALPAAAGAQETARPEPGPPTLSVVGVGAVEARPDTATIDIGIRQTGVARESVRRNVNRRTARIIARLRGLGVSRADLQTSGIGLDQVSLRPLKRGGPRRIRFVAFNSLAVRTQELRLVGPIFDAATRAGATEFRGPEYRVENRTPPRADATAAAVRDARRRAESAAAELGRRIVGVRSVVLDPDRFQSGGGTDESATLPASGEADAPTPAAPGTETITAEVSVVFELSE